MLKTAIAVIGPPAAGKTTLTLQLGQSPGRRVFRLREHVPHAVLAATATDAAQLGWIDNFTVITSVHQYVETLIRDSTVDMLLLDNFPGTGTQVSLFLSVLRQLAPRCSVMAVELTADPMVLRHRAMQRRVCPTCEHDPLCDPRLPAEASPADPSRCARCNQQLDARRGDQPVLYKARLQRYQQLATDIRQAFTAAGVAIVQIDSGHTLDQTAHELMGFLAP